MTTLPRDPRAMRSAFLFAVPLTAILVLVIGLVTPGRVGEAKRVPTTCDGNAAVGRAAQPCLGFAVGYPTIDGEIADDLGWLNAFRYTMDDLNGTGVATATMQGIRASDALYLSFEINNDTQFDPADAIVLAFDPTGVATNRRRIHIYPVESTGALVTKAPRQVDYWKDSTSPSWNQAVNPAPAWVKDNIKVMSAETEASRHYRVEMKIPIVPGEAGNGINLPTTDDFGLFVYVVDAYTTGGTTEWASEMSWPPNTPVGDFLEQTPTADKWGNGLLGFVSNGVSVRTPTTNHGSGSIISLNEPNQFSAVVDNNMRDASNAIVTAKQVGATFKIANVGIPGATSWAEVPAPGNPTPLLDIAGAARTYSTGWWSVAGTPDEANYRAHPSQCVKVYIESKEPETLIVNRWNYNNMTFMDTASPFDAKATIGIEGYKLPEGQSAHEFLLSEFHYGTPAKARWASSIKGLEPISSPPTKTGTRRLQYMLRVDPRNEQGMDLAMRIAPPPGTRVPRQIVRLRPGARGEARLTVRPGNIVTVYTSGSVQLRRTKEGPFARPVGANGFNLAATAERPKTGRYLLGTEYAPESQVGAVVASIDRFKQRAFPIGAYSTFQVPAGATELAFGINDTLEGSKQQSGKGYTLEVVQTRPEQMYRVTNAQVSAKAPKNVQFLPTGVNLPTWIMCGKRITPSTVTILGRKFRRAYNVGCFGYLVKSIGAQLPKPLPR